MYASFGLLMRCATRVKAWLIEPAQIDGRFDIGRPQDVPWLLHQAWPGSELHLVSTGHQGGDEMAEHMMSALNRCALT